MIKISETNKKEADRVGGVALHIPWPDALGATPEIKIGEEYDARATEHAWATRQLPWPMRAKTGYDVVHVATRIKSGYRVGTQDQQLGVYLVLILIGTRWVAAKGNPRAREMMGVVE